MYCMSTCHTHVKVRGQSHVSPHLLPRLSLGPFFLVGMYTWSTCFGGILLFLSPRPLQGTETTGVHDHVSPPVSVFMCMCTHVCMYKCMPHTCEGQDNLMSDLIFYLLPEHGAWPVGSGCQTHSASAQLREPSSQAHFLSARRASSLFCVLSTSPWPDPLSFLFLRWLLWRMCRRIPLNPNC